MAAFATCLTFVVLVVWRVLLYALFPPRGMIWQEHVTTEVDSKSFFDQKIVELPASYISVDCHRFHPLVVQVALLKGHPHLLPGGKKEKRKRKGDLI